MNIYILASRFDSACWQPGWWFLSDGSRLGTGSVVVRLDQQ